MAEDRARLNRLRAWILALVLVIVFTSVAAPTLVLVFVGQQANHIQLEVTCSILQAEVDQLQAVTRNGNLIEEIARNLGLPIQPPPEIVIPEVPAECDMS